MTPELCMIHMHDETKENGDITHMLERNTTSGQPVVPSPPDLTYSPEHLSSRYPISVVFKSLFSWRTEKKRH